jgi:DNA mismatch repair protein MutS
MPTKKAKNGDDTKMVGEYLKQTEHYQQLYGKYTIIIMLVGTFYEIYGVKSQENQEDFEGTMVKEVSQICDLVIARKSYTYYGKIVYQSGFRDIYWEKYVERLTQNNFCCVKFDQDPNDKTKRILSQIYSPGTFFQYNQYKLSNHTVCIWVEQLSTPHSKIKSNSVSYVLGFSCIDINSGKTNIFELNETAINDELLGDEIERYLTIYQPSEVLIIMRTKGIYDKKVGKTIAQMVEHACPMVTYFDETVDASHWDVVLKCEKQNYMVDQINTFFKDDVFDMIMQTYYSHSFSCQSFAFLLHWVNSHNPRLVHKISYPFVESHGTNVYLANNSLSQLNFVTGDNDNDFIRNRVNTSSRYNQVKYACVLDLLNQCITPMGKRTYQDVLLHPIFDVHKLQESYDMIDALMNNCDSVLNTRNKLKECYDIDKLLRSLMTKRISPRMLRQLYESALLSKHIYSDTLNLIPSSDSKTNTVHTDIQTQKHIECIKSRFIDCNHTCDIDGRENHFKHILDVCDEFIRFFKNIFCIPVLNENDNFHLENNIFHPKYDEELYAIERERNNLEKKFSCLSSLLNTAVVQQERQNNWNLSLSNDSIPDYIKIIESDKSPNTLTCTKRRSELLKSSLDTLLNTQSKSNSEYKGLEFVYNDETHMIDSLTFTRATATTVSIHCHLIDTVASELFKIQQQWKERLQVVFKSAIEDMIKRYSSLHTISSYISLYDIETTKMYISQKYNYCKPNITIKTKTHVNTSIDNESRENREKIGSQYTNDDDTNEHVSHVYAENMRHVLVEQLQNDDAYIPNTMTFDSENQGILLYGTNAVGKTSLMKALGITLIMAQSGMYVPCSQFNFYPYKKIFTRILNQDNILKGLSLFANEMVELRNILNNSCRNSIVLGDELCSGTEHESAVSIFVSGLSWLYNHGVQFIFATHLHEIVNYPEVTDMEHLHMFHLTVHYNREIDALVYDRKLQPGSGLPVYGLEVCQSMHLPLKFLENAYHFRNKYYPTNVSILEAKQSHFNSQKLLTTCELCKTAKAVHVHHLMYQKHANDDGYFDTTSSSNKLSNGTHKNHKSNLCALCEECHHKVHQDDIKYMRLKTTRGYVLEK